MDKDNKLNYESAQTQIKTLPESYKAATVACIEKCKDAGEYIKFHIFALYFQGIFRFRAGIGFMAGIYQLCSGTIKHSSNFPLLSDAFHIRQS